MRSMVEGARHTSRDRREDAFQILEHLARRDAKNVASVLAEKRIAALVIGGRVTTIVKFAIDLDREMGRTAIEVGDIGADRMPLTELHTELLAAKLRPQTNFGRRHLAAEPTGAVDPGLYHASCTPSTTPRKRGAVPLPVPGRNGRNFDLAHPNNRSFTTFPPCVRRIALPISSSSTGLPASLSQKALRKL